jgi:general secretion pathway protein J
VNRVRPSGGFTLLEVLLAMAITAIVTLMAYSGLSAALNSADSLRTEGQRISEVNRAYGLFSRDLSHFVDRPVRNEFGATVPALVGGERVEKTLAFTRVGWFNTLGRPRSHMQRVRYVLEDTTLYREQFQVLDRTNESEPQRVALLENVNTMEFRFLPDGFDLPVNDELETDRWPEAWGLDGGQGVNTLPQAVEVRLELEDWGEVRWLYEMPQSPL